MSVASRSRLALLALAAASPGAAAADNGPTPAPLFGYFDPQTHVFTPAPASVMVKPAAPTTTAPQSNAAAAATIVRSGTVTITATVHLVSTIPTNASFYTNMTIGVSDPSTAAPPSYSSSAEAFSPTVTRSGSVVTVKAVIPYRFVYTVAADQMTVAFNISYDGGNYPRFSYQRPIAVPANGANTAVPVAASL